MSHFWLKTLTASIPAIVALGIAIFHEQLRTLFLRPKLRISIEETDPADCHLTTIINVKNNAQAPCYYFRMKIYNDGQDTARDVEVIIEKVSKQRADGKFEKWKEFIPLNLVWSHTKIVYYPRISPHTKKHCDLGHIIEPSGLISIEPVNPALRQHQNQTILLLDLVVKPFTGTFFLCQGNYRIDIIAVASNAKPIRQTLEINFDGTWDQNDETMLRDHIGIKMIP